MNEVWLVGIIVSAYITTVGGVIAAFISRSGRKQNGNTLAPKEIETLVENCVLKHRLTCPLKEEIAKLLEQMKADLKEMIQNQEKRLTEFIQRYSK